MFPQWRSSTKLMINQFLLDCEEGDVRLTEGHEGTVEICLNSLWGMIAQSGWSSIDGEVVCQQLGYTSEGMCNRHTTIML